MVPPQERLRRGHSRRGLRVFRGNPLPRRGGPHRGGRPARGLPDPERRLPGADPDGFPLRLGPPGVRRPGGRRPCRSGRPSRICGVPRRGRSVRIGRRPRPRAPAVPAPGSPGKPDLLVRLPLPLLRGGSLGGDPPGHQDPGPGPGDVPGGGPGGGDGDRDRQRVGTHRLGLGLGSDRPDPDRDSPVPSDLRGFPVDDHRRRDALRDRCLPDSLRLRRPSGVFPPLVREVFGQRYAGANFGMVLMALGLSSLVFSRISGLLSAGGAATGDYSASFYLTAALGAAAAVFMAAAGRLWTVDGGQWTVNSEQVNGSESRKRPHPSLGVVGFRTL
ncbi:MAG: hypothetical protein MZU97_12615 [Bacillus subtilis]|nr:hypothetical protein [Bacillus subtilis]